MPGLVMAAQAFSLLWGVLVPAAVFLVAAGVTFLLYRHFARQ